MDLLSPEIKQIFAAYAALPQAYAVAAGGSAAAGTADGSSDIDIYVFVSEDVPKEKRLETAKKFAKIYDIGNDYYGPGDEYYAENAGRPVDIMYFSKDWIEGIIHSVWEQHNPWNGYTTCFLYTLKNCVIYEDNQGWLAAIKKKLSQPYPSELRRNIIRRNMLMMKEKPFASFYEQTEKAAKCGDAVSINHRAAAFIASYFDALFAANSLLHPGEKRLSEYAEKHCKLLPENFRRDISAAAAASPETVLQAMQSLYENLRKICDCG